MIQELRYYKKRSYWIPFYGMFKHYYDAKKTRRYPSADQWMWFEMYCLLSSLFLCLSLLTVYLIIFKNKMTQPKEIGYKVIFIKFDEETLRAVAAVEGEIKEALNHDQIMSAEVDRTKATDKMKWSTSMTTELLMEIQKNMGYCVLEWDTERNKVRFVDGFAIIHLNHPLMLKVLSGGYGKDQEAELMLFDISDKIMQETIETHALMSREDQRKQLPRFYIWQSGEGLAVCREGIETKDINRYQTVVPFTQVEPDPASMMIIGRVSPKATWVKASEFYDWDKVSPDHSHHKKDSYRVIYAPTRDHNTLPCKQWSVRYVIGIVAFLFSQFLKTFKMEQQKVRVLKMVFIYFWQETLRAVTAVNGELVEALNHDKIMSAKVDISWSNFREQNTTSITADLLIQIMETNKGLCLVEWDDESNKVHLHDDSAVLHMHHPFITTAWSQIHNLSSSESSKA